MSIRTVLIQGAFDILNMGHVKAFEYARSQGDWLIVALNTNELIAEYKKRVAVMPWEHKKTIIEAVRWVDEVVPAPDFSPLELLKAHHIDVYVLCEEWLGTKQAEIAYMEAKGGRVCVTPRFTDVGTREIKAKLLAEHLGERPLRCSLGENLRRAEESVASFRNAVAEFTKELRDAREAEDACS